MTLSELVEKLTALKNHFLFYYMETQWQITGIYLLNKEFLDKYNL